MDKKKINLSLMLTSLLLSITMLTGYPWLKELKDEYPLLKRFLN